MDFQSLLVVAAAIVVAAAEAASEAAAEAAATTNSSDLVLSHVSTMYHTVCASKYFIPILVNLNLLLMAKSSYRSLFNNSLAYLYQRKM